MKAVAIDNLTGITPVPPQFPLRTRQLVSFGIVAFLTYFLSNGFISTEKIFSAAEFNKLL
jgi:hypothetical protein